MFPSKWVVCGLTVAALMLAVPPSVAEEPAKAAAPKEPSVFDSPSPAPAGGKTSRSITGADRYVGDEPDYNTEQRAQWLEACAPLKETDLKAYRDCFAKQKQKSKDKLKRQFEEAERRQGRPFRNTGSVPETGEPPRNPSFDVEVESVKD